MGRAASRLDSWQLRLGPALAHTWVGGRKAGTLRLAVSVGLFLCGSFFLSGRYSLDVLVWML